MIGEDKGRCEGFPSSVESEHVWLLFMALALLAAWSPFSRALNHAAAFKLMLFRTKATVLNHIRTSNSFYPWA